MNDSDKSTHYLLGQLDTSTKEILRQQKETKESLDHIQYKLGEYSEELIDTKHSLDEAHTKIRVLVDADARIENRLTKLERAIGKAATIVSLVVAAIMFFAQPIRDWVMSLLGAS